jgi:hypothetical protein
LQRVLHITAPIKWIDVIFLFLILASGVYQFIETLSIFYGICLFIILILLLFFLFGRDEVRFDTSGEGVVETKHYTLIGIKKHKYQGLSKAKDIIKVDVSGVDTGKNIEGYLLFDDGYRQPIPGDDTSIEKIISWFKNNYGTSLSIKKERS